MPSSWFTEMHQLDTFYNALNPTDQDSLNSAVDGNLLERRTQDVLTIIKNKSKVQNSRNKSIVSQVKSSDANSNPSSEIAKLTHAVNQQTIVVTTAMTAILKQFQATPPPASVKASNSVYRPPGVANQIRPSGFAQPNVQNNQNWFSQPEGYNRGNNFNQDQSYQAPTQQNQVVPLRLGSLPRNTIANPKRELKAITTRSGIVLDGPSVPIPPLFIIPEEDERVEKTLTDQDLVEYTIKVLLHLVQNPSLLLKETLLFIKGILFTPISLILQGCSSKIPKMLKALLSNKEKLLELANTPLNENCSAVILKKLPEKLGDPEKFLISCGFSELKCKALANLGASINLLPLSIWKKLGLPELISTRMTLERANQAICTPAGIARDVFIPVGKFTFLADFALLIMRVILESPSSWEDLYYGPPVL
nr:reverse transcriptase domain-containing protein [Tanacetum cinerariifolium]